jgi:predicted RNase H-like HicB family nuclease
MTAYIALLRKDSDSDIGVEFPDFPGCVTAGRSLEEAPRMAAEALELHIDGMAEDHTEIPSPSTLDAVMAQAEHRDSVAMLIEVATRPAKSVRVNVTLPQDLLDAIDRTTKNRSRFLAEAARAKLHESTA